MISPVKAKGECVECVSPQISVRRGILPWSEGEHKTNSMGNGVDKLVVSDVLRSCRIEMKEMKGMEYATNNGNSKTANGIKLIGNEYAVLKKLGVGAYGKVALGFNIHTNNCYAIKAIDKSKLRKLAKAKASNPNQRGRGGGAFAMRGRLGMKKAPQEESAVEEVSLKEVAILKKLNHPNIVQLYSCLDDKQKGKFYLIYEFAEGGTVMEVGEDNKLKGNKRPLSEEKARKYFREMMCGIDYLHRSGIIHRDLKPENLLLTKGDVLKVTDFGVSKILNSSNDILTSTQGTHLFFPPEACQPGPCHGRPFDIWSSAVCLYIFLFGEFPFFSTLNIVEIYNKIKEAKLEFPTWREISDDLKDLFSKMFEKDPEKRLTMDGVFSHPWVTEKGTNPLVNPVPSDGIDVTAFDEENAISEVRPLEGCETGESKESSRGPEPFLSANARKLLNAGHPIFGDLFFPCEFSLAKLEKALDAEDP